MTQPETLEDLVYLQRGFDITKAQQVSGDIPVISSSGANSSHNVAKVKGPGVIIGRKGTLGTVHWSESDYWPHDTTLWSKDLKGNYPKYVYYFLKRLNLERFDTGSSNPTLNRNHIHSLSINIHELEQQKEIAATLSAYDDLIAVNTRRIALLEEAGRHLYREWFVFEPQRESGEQSLCSKQAFKPLGELISINPDTYKPGKLPDWFRYIDIASVKSGQINHNTEISSLEAPSRARRGVRHLDVIRSNVRPNLKGYAFVLDPKQTDICSTGFTVMRARSVSPYFLYFLATSDTFTQHLTNVATGTSYPAVKVGDYSAFKVIVPPKCLDQRFSEFCEQIFDQISQLSQSNVALARARDLLLPRLMDGRIELAT